MYSIVAITVINTQLKGGSKSSHLCDRCPAYSGLPKFCHLQPDPTDACCKKPVCTVQGMQLVPQIGGTPTRSPTLEPSITNVIPLGTHTIISGSSRLPGEGVQTIYGGRCESGLCGFVLFGWGWVGHAVRAGMGTFFVG